jgi:hypothetical protein
VKPRPLRLGEILEQRGRLAHEQTLRALRNQKVLGGRLGTCLLEIDAVSEEELLNALAEIHGVPAAHPDDLRNIPAETIGLIPAKVAERCQAVPFHSSSTQVKVAVTNARNLSIQDEISFVVGKRIRWHIASDLRIYEALEKYYGVECPTRFAKLLDRMNRSRFLWAKEGTAATAETLSLPAWELPPSIPAAEPATAAEIPAKVQAVPENVPPASPPETQAPPPLATTISEPARGADDDTQDLEPALRPQGLFSIDEAEKRLLDPKDRDDVARTLLRFMSGRSRRAVLLVVRKDEVAAWLWSGDGLKGPTLAAFRSTLAEPSVVQTLRASKEPFQGVLPQVPAHQALLAAFDPPATDSVFVALPVRVRGKLVAVLLYEPPAAGESPESKVETNRIVAKAAIAFELCIMRAKLRKA